MSEKIKNDSLVETLVRRTKKSHQAYEKAKEIIPAGVVSRGRLYPPYPFFVRKAKEALCISLIELNLTTCRVLWLMVMMFLLFIVK